MDDQAEVRTDKTEKKPRAAGESPGPAGAEMSPPKAWADAAGMKPWELAGLMRFARWVDGKVVTAAEFDAALNKFRARPLGGGRI